MVEGESRRFWIPEALAYKGQPGKPAGTLVFDVELIEVKKLPPPPFPAEAADIPEGATALGDDIHLLTTRQPRKPPGQGSTLRPEAGDDLQIRFSAWTRGGEYVDGVPKRGAPRTFSMSDVPEAWARALVTMEEREIIRLWAPAGLSGTGEKAASEDMVYEIELVKVDRTLPAPEDVESPPASAVTTDSGLAYVRLKKGAGRDHPTARAEVEVHYTGWTTDGAMFDSSVIRGKPSTFKASQVIDGWTEALQLMVEGDTFRVWIPEELAYAGKRGKPAGMLVFDVELVDIKSKPAPPPDAPSNADSPPASATEVEPGITYSHLSKARSSGDSPAIDDWVELDIIAWLQDDGSYVTGNDETGEPITVQVKGLSQAWQKVLTRVRPGDSVRIWSSATQSTMGRKGSPGALVADLKLRSIGPTPEVPYDVAAPPADAKETSTGLRYKVLRTGTGSIRPSKASRVTVHYSGWTTDGELFDSSVQRMAPSTFPLTRVIPGWTEGLQLMVAGEKTRFWIPVDLAYKGAPGKPAGMLVFDVELVGIDE
jgi:FKBP-type peptidyl-prolyl cis-trans isomerase